MSSFDFDRKYQHFKVKKRSAFNKNTRHLLTTKVGTITPILVDELIPNSTIHLDAAINASLPPLATSTYMSVGLEITAFFTPLRILVGSFEDWLTGNKLYNQSGGEAECTIPVLRLNSGSTSTVPYLGANTLSDYLGYRISTSDMTTPSQFATSDWNIFPFLCYQRIYDDWFRNTMIQKGVFHRVSGAYQISSNAGAIPYYAFSGTTVYPYTLSSKLFDGVALGSLRQRNFDLDLFTSAQPTAQKGDPQKITMTADVSGQSEFTVASLRAATALQTWAEKMNFSTRLQDYVKIQYGAHLSDGMAQRSLYLGRQYIPIYSKGVYQTAPSTQDSTSTTNPFGNVGSDYGHAVCVGKGNLVKSFTAQEPGILMVLATVVPEVTYSSGFDRMNYHYNSHNSVTDMANPTLQHVGNQPIYQGELSPLRAVSADGGTSVFAYTDRYYEYMSKPSRLSGLLRDGRSLEAFALQRTFSGTSSLTLNDSFLQIPTSYLDQVSATRQDISDYGVWMDCYFRYTVVQPLAAYSIPCIVDPSTEHGKDVEVKKGGRSVY